MRSFSFYRFICWQSPRNLDKLISKCSCDLVFWMATSNLSGDLQSFHCLISEYSTLSLCLKRWTLAPERPSILPERLWGEVHNAFLCKPSSMTWCLLHLSLPAAQHGVGCGGSSQEPSSSTGCTKCLGRGCESAAEGLRDCCCCREWAVLCHWGSHCESMRCLALSCVSGLLSVDAALWKPFQGAQWLVNIFVSPWS